MTTTVDPQPFGEWVIVEQLGHRKLAGYLTEQTIAGGGYLRLDVPAAGDHPAATHLIAHASVYAIHPVTEAMAHTVAQRYRPEPVSRWELPAAPAQPSPLERAVELLFDTIVDADGRPVHAEHPEGASVSATCPGCIAVTLRNILARCGTDEDETETLVSVPEHDYDGEGPF